MGSSGDRPRIRWVTDVDYPARGRDYGAEDRWLVARLAPEFQITPVHPRGAVAAGEPFDLVVVRNSGPVAGYPLAYAEFREWAIARDALVYNELTGRGDMLGKGYLLELHAQGMPVIPTTTPGNLDAIPAAAQYVAKPLHGADSDGLAFLSAAEAATFELPEMIIQPRIDMRAELSFVFVDDAFQYALSTIPGHERWQLQPYAATDEDLAFARRFIEWNAVRHGIQRVDACRTADGELLLVELEDLNPYLSLDLLANDVRERFVASFAAALRRLLDTR